MPAEWRQRKSLIQERFAIRAQATRTTEGASECQWRQKSEGRRQKVEEVKVCLLPSDFCLLPSNFSPTQQATALGVASTSFASCARMSSKSYGLRMNPTFGFDRYSSSFAESP